LTTIVARPPAARLRTRAPKGARVRFGFKVVAVAARERRNGQCDSPTLCRGANGADDIATVSISLLATVGENLIRDFAAVDFNCPGEVESDAHTVAFDRHDANNTNRGRWVSDDDFFTFASCDDKHGDLLPKSFDLSATWLTR